MSIADLCNKALQSGESVEALRVNKRPELSKRKQSETDGRQSQWWYTVRDKRYGHNLVPASPNTQIRTFFCKQIVCNDTRLHSVTPKDGKQWTPKSLALWLNSTFVALAMQVSARTNFGQGATDIKCYEYEALSCPTPETLRKIDTIYRTSDHFFKRHITDIWDEVNKPDKIRLDEVILETLGLPKTMRESLANATVLLVRQRIEKAASLKPKASRERIEAAEKTRGIWVGIPDEEEDEAREG